MACCLHSAMKTRVSSSADVSRNPSEIDVLARAQAETAVRLFDEALTEVEASRR